MIVCHTIYKNYGLYRVPSYGLAILGYVRTFACQFAVISESDLRDYSFLEFMVYGLERFPQDYSTLILICEPVL